MAIPESQLDTWAHQGSVSQSSATYSTIKNVLEAAETPYTGKSYSVFLQGSYGNDTNIYTESDVDIVIQLNDCFQSDVEALSQAEKDAYNALDNAVYTHIDFKRDVVKVLGDKYGSDLKVGNKAITLEARGNRRKTDVITSIQFRRYYKFRSIHDQRYDEGICFYDLAGKRIVNYPRQHSANCTTKHQTTNKWFKPMVRVLKNMRSKLVEDKMIKADVAPSYYIEGLLYNVPNELFGNSYGDTFANCVNWILEADRSKFLCVNEQYYLLREASPVTWREAKCTEFLAAVCDLWQQW